MSKPKSIEILDVEGGYTFRELTWQLAKFRGGRVPDRTLRFWLNELGIRSKSLYSVDDLKLLVRLVNFLKRCRSTMQFKQILLEEMRNAKTATDS